MANITRILTFVFCSICCACAWAQRCPEPKYDCFLLNGRKFFDDRKLDAARGYFLAAADCDDAPDNPHEIEYWIDEVEKRLPHYRIEQRARTLALLSDKVDPTQSMRLLSLSYRLDSTLDSTRLRIINRYANSIEKPFYCAAYEHPTEIRTVAVSPDGTRFITTIQGAAYLWRIENMDRPLAILRHGRDKTVWSAYFSSDGTRILTASDDSTAKLWNGTGDLLRVFKYRSELNGAVFSPDNTRILALASNNNAALVWEIATAANTNPKELKHLGMVRFARFSADGTRILTTSDDKTAVLWSVVSLTRIATFRHENPVSGGAIAPNASQIITFTDNGAAFLWSSSGVKIKPLLHDKRILHAEFSHDGNRAITSSADFSTKLWDVKTTISQPITTFRHGNAVLYAAFSPDDSRVITASSDKTAKAWDIKFPNVPFAVFYHSDIVQMACFSANGERVLTCSNDKFAKLWDLYHSSPIRLFWSAHGGSLFAPPESPIIPSPSYIIDWLDDATIAPLQNDLRLKYGTK